MLGGNVFAADIIDPENIGVTSANLETANKAYVKNGATGGTIGDPDDPFSSIRNALDSYSNAGPLIRHLVLIPAEWGEPFIYEANIDDVPFFVESCHKPQLSSYSPIVDIVASARITLNVSTVIPEENNTLNLNISSDGSASLTLSGVQGLACSTFILNLHSLATFTWDEIFSEENLLWVDITIRNSGPFYINLVSATTNPSLDGCHIFLVNSGGNDSAFNISSDSITSGPLAYNGTYLEIYGSMLYAVNSMDNISGTFAVSIGGSGYGQMNVAPTEFIDLGSNYIHNFW